MAGEPEGEVATPMPTAKPMVPQRDADAHGMLMSLVKVSQTVLESAGRIAEQARDSVETSRKLSDTAVLVAEEAQRTIHAMREAADMEIGALRRRLEETTQLPPQRLVAPAIEGEGQTPEVAPPVVRSSAPAARQRSAPSLRHLMARDGWLVPTVILVCFIMIVAGGIVLWRRPGDAASAAADTQGVIMSAPPRGDSVRPAPAGRVDRIPDRYLAPDDRGGN
jgi:hypothetical protein